MIRHTFKQDRVRTHHDGPKNVEQIYLVKPYQWLCSAKTPSEARRLIKMLKQLLRAPQGAQIVSHLYPVVEETDHE